MNYTEKHEPFEEWASHRRVIKHRKGHEWDKWLLDIYRADVVATPEERLERRGNHFVSATLLYTHGYDADRQLIKDNWEKMHTYVQWQSTPLAG